MSGIGVEAAPSPRGLRWFTTKPLGVTWLSHKTKTRGSAGGDGIQARQEALKQATRDMIEVFALGGCEGPMDARPSDGELHVLTKIPCEGLYCIS
jgi:hypothetical protein